MNNEEKEKQKEIKHREKMIARTRKKAKVPNNATYEEANEFILKYASTMKSGFEKFYLTNEQKNDPNFLLALYNANLEFTFWKRPSAYNEKLTSNVEFMIEFIKLAVKREISLRRGWGKINNEDYEQELTYLVRGYKYLFNKPEFFEKLSEEYQFVNLVEVILGSVKHYTSFDIFNKATMKKIEENYKSLMMSLSKEILTTQVKIFGLKVLKELPKELPYFAELVDICITKEGFKALKYLPVEQVLENKDLVIKAYSVDGIHALAYYIMNDLEPNRTHSYMCHGDDHWYTQYHEEYAIAQKGLLEDETIRTLFTISKKALSGTSERYVKMTLDALHLLDDEKTNTENKSTTPTNDNGEDDGEEE